MGKKIGSGTRDKQNDLVLFVAIAVRLHGEQRDSSVLAVVYGSSLQLLGGFRYSAAGGLRGGASATLPGK
jgi:hypothetical protein